MRRKPAGERPEVRQQDAAPAAALVPVWCGFVSRLALAAIAIVLAAEICPAEQKPAQAPESQATPQVSAFSGATPVLGEPETDALLRWTGLPVRRISFEGIPADRLRTITDRLEIAEGKPLEPTALKNSLRLIFSTGLYDDVEIRGEREGDGVAVTFTGRPRTFIGVVSVYGAIGPTMNTQLTRASQLEPGTRLTQEKMNRAFEQMRTTLAENGYHQPAIYPELTNHPEDQLVDIVFRVASGPQARVGKVTVTGDSGLNAEEFHHYAHLRTGAHVDHDTINRALDGVLKHYQRGDRLEADVKLESAQYDPATKVVNFRFSSNRGPVVKVFVEGAKLSQERIKRLIPVYEEGTVDEDLLNEGNRRLRDYYQRLGYFDVKVAHDQPSGSNQQVSILFRVQLGSKRRVEQVSIIGNRYFDTPTLLALLSVRAASPLDRHGSYSQSLVAADVSALEAVYQNNGFAKVKVTPETSTPETVLADKGPPSPGSPTVGETTDPLSVAYHIEEGPQMRVGVVKIEGNDHIGADKLAPLMNTAAGQLLSPQNLSGDRDAILTAYLSKGFEQASVDISQNIEETDPAKVDITFRIIEGDQVFVRKVLLSGIHYTRPDTVTRAITIHAGDPLDQSALLDTQRNLYNYALFNEVNTAIQNPTGGEPYKTVLLQFAEARRWTLTYGFGFEAQTGQPQNNCAGALAGGVACNPNGKTGVSPRVLIDVTRNNVFGREQSASIQATYGLLEQRLGLLYQIPHFEGAQNFGLSFAAGYANSQDVATYVASRLDGDFRLTQKFATPGSHLSKANTFIYELDFRRVKVAADTLQVYPGEISELATAARVAGPAFTWIRDTRDQPMDAHRGTYTSFQDFLSIKAAGAQPEFNRIDVTNSSYYGFDKDKFVLARDTRYGQIRAFGAGISSLIPLPERLYGGGPTSLRGFPFNAAGPRDPETGFPIGGAGALIESTELRLPPPTLPFFGNTLSFVLFHDMGNVFTNAGDAWISALRIHQPDRDACKVLSPPDLTTNPPTPPSPTGPSTSTGRQGDCNFNYFSHSPGLGLRYHTPVGPIRLDFSYNLNPPIYPVNIDYSRSNVYSDQHVGQSPHFNFVFSLGQAF
ncbi:MAG TPA: POTRA domain-containing protein [Terracidiphilus sp.]|nr:POTRA domain-containing protein [Terracidiphilus sp.]